MANILMQQVSPLSFGILVIRIVSSISRSQMVRKVELDAGSLSGDILKLAHDGTFGNDLVRKVEFNAVGVPEEASNILQDGIIGGGEVLNGTTSGKDGVRMAAKPSNFVHNSMVRKFSVNSVGHVNGMSTATEPERDVTRKVAINASGLVEEASKIVQNSSMRTIAVTYNGNVEATARNRATDVSESLTLMHDSEASAAQVSKDQSETNRGYESNLPSGPLASQPHRHSETTTIAPLMDLNRIASNHSDVSLRSPWELHEPIKRTREMGVKISASPIVPNTVRDRSKNVRAEGDPDATIGSSVVDTVDVLRTSGRLQNGKDTFLALDGFKPPRFCKRSSVQPSKQDPIPGFFSKRIAFILNRASFRGLIEPSTQLITNKIKVACTAKAHAIQMAINRAIVGNIFEPIEEAGFAVDVFLQTYPCSIGAVRDAYWKDLKTSLGSHRIMAWRTHEHNLTISSGRAQASAMKTSFQILEDHMRQHSKRYRSVLIWRFDMPPVEKLAAPAAQMQTLLSVYDKGPTLQAAKEQFDLGAARYLLWSTTYGGYMGSNKDQIFSIPGWVLPCYFGYILHTPEISMDDWWPDDGHPHDFLKSTELINRASKIGSRLSVNLFDALGKVGIYRGHAFSFDDGGTFDCRYLRTFFSGPPCGPVWEAEELCEIYEGFGRIPAASQRLALEDAFDKFYSTIIGNEEKRRTDPRFQHNVKRIASYHLEPTAEEHVTRDKYMKQVLTSPACVRLLKNAASLSGSTLQLRQNDFDVFPETAAVKHMVRNNLSNAEPILHSPIAEATL